MVTQTSAVAAAGSRRVAEKAAMDLATTVSETGVSADYVNHSQQDDGKITEVLTNAYMFDVHNN